MDTFGLRLPLPIFRHLSLLELAEAVSRAVRLDGRRRAAIATAGGAGTRPSHERRVLQLCDCADGNGAYEGDAVQLQWVHCHTSPNLAGTTLTNANRTCEISGRRFDKAREQVVDEASLDFPSILKMLDHNSAES
jgi:hypothetical protein